MCQSGLRLVRLKRWQQFEDQKSLWPGQYRYVHGSQKRIEQALERRGYNVPNTSAIERRNGTARLMSAALVRKTLASAGKESTKAAMGWRGMMVYNWRRPHPSSSCYLHQ